MSKLLSTLIAAAFAVTTFGAAAQTTPAPGKGDAPKEAPATPSKSDKSKSDKSKADKSKSDKPKTDQKAKSDKKKSEGKPKGDGKKGDGKKGDGKKSEKAAAPAKDDTKK